MSGLEPVAPPEAIVRRPGRGTVRLIGVVTASASCLAAASVAVSTIVLVVRFHYPLPWFDEWYTIGLLRAWRGGDTSLWAALVSRHNEHRILFPRLVFFADALWFGGRGWLSLWASTLVQALHAAMFAWLLAGARPATPARWVIGAAVVAMMFSLGQVENFASGFQLQFFGVFAAATATFLAFGRVVALTRAGESAHRALAESLALATVATFTMANGILAAALLPVLALLARLRGKVAALTAAWAILLGAVYRLGQTGADPGDGLQAFESPGRLVAYVATYTGNALQIDRLIGATSLGYAALALVAIAAVRALRTPPKGETVALLGVMLFVVLSGIATATGRMQYGLAQALSIRYVTGAMTFWAAALTYGWVDPLPGRAARATRAVVFFCGVLFIVGACRVEKTGHRLLAAQYALQVRAGDALLQGRNDVAAIAAGAGDAARVERLVPVLRDLRISIFARRPGDAPTP